MYFKRFSNRLANSKKMFKIYFYYACFIIMDELLRNTSLIIELRG